MTENKIYQFIIIIYGNWSVWTRKSSSKNWSGHTQPFDSFIFFTAGVVYG